MFKYKQIMYYKHFRLIRFHNVYGKFQTLCRYMYSVLCTMCHTFGRQIIEIYIFVWLFKIDINYIINIRKY